MTKKEKRPTPKRSRPLFTRREVEDHHKDMAFLSGMSDLDEAIDHLHSAKAALKSFHKMLFKADS